MQAMQQVTLCTAALVHKGASHSCQALREILEGLGESQGFHIQEPWSRWRRSKLFGEYHYHREDDTTQRLHTQKAHRYRRFSRTEERLVDKPDQLKRMLDNGHEFEHPDTGARMYYLITFTQDNSYCKAIRIDG